MAKIKRCLEPGGWVELAELGSELYSDDNTMAPGNGLKVQFDLVRESMERIGRSFPDEEALRKRLIDAGFEDVHCVNYKHPIGPWAKDKKMKHIGAMVLLSFETGLEVCLPPSRAGSTSAECGYLMADAGIWHGCPHADHENEPRGGGQDYCQRLEGHQEQEFPHIFVLVSSPPTLPYPQREAC